MQKASKIYLDHVSTSAIDEEVLATYTRLLKDYYNSDALYEDGVTVYRNQEKSRTLIAEMLGVKYEEIIFTSGASEANNLVIKGLSLLHQGGHIISSSYEHSSVDEALKQVAKYLRIKVTYLDPKKDGRIDPLDVRNALRDDTFLVTIMMVNNEIGAINDISAIHKVIKDNAKALFHSDMTQALGKCEICLKDVDMASFSAHKIHGVKGSGFLYKRKHIEIAPLISAGQQEFHLRGGTSNSPANIVLAKTIRKALKERETYGSYMQDLHSYALEQLAKIPDVTINSPKDGIFGLINISTPVKTEVMINALDLHGIMVSGKSTCGSREDEPSHTLKAMHIDSEYALRISFDHTMAKEKIDIFIKYLKETIDRYAR